MQFSPSVMGLPSATTQAPNNIEDGVFIATCLAKMTPCVVALQSMRSFTKTQYSMT
jgi:hypothetical protein